MRSHSPDKDLALDRLHVLARAIDSSSRLRIPTARDCSVAAARDDAGPLRRAACRIFRRRRSATVDYHSWIEGETLDMSIEADDNAVDIFVYVAFGAENTAAVRSVVRSLECQDDSRWQIHFVPLDSAAAEIAYGFAQRDGRLHAVAPIQQDRSRGLAEAIAMQGEDAFVILDPSDQLAPHAIRLLRAALSRDAELAAVFADEDRLDAAGRRTQPWCKPQMTFSSLTRGDLLGRPIAYRATVVAEAGGLRPEFGPAMEYDLALRVLSPDRVHRIPRFLCHRALPPASAGGDPHQIVIDRLPFARALEHHFESRGETAIVVPDPSSTTMLRTGFRHQELPRVSVIVPFRDKPQLLRTCAHGLLQKTSYPDIELLLVDTGSELEATARLLDELERDPRVRRIVIGEQPFNYSRVNNTAAREASGELLLLLNNDIEILDDPDWLTAMAEWALRPSIGLVGATLLFPDGRLQHAGVTLGMRGFAGHPWSLLPRDAWTAFGSPAQLHDWLSVTGACLLLRKHLWNELGGFDEEFQLCGSDVELGLRAHASGLHNVVLPWVVLNHHESASRGTWIPEHDFVASERAYRPWILAGDPCFSPVVSLHDEQCMLRPADEVAAVDPLPRERTRIHADV